MGRDGKLTTYLAVGMVTVGFVLMFVAWNGAAELDFVQGQLPYLLSGTMPGLGLVLTGLTLVLVQEMRRLAAQLISRAEATATATVDEGPARLPTVVPDGDHVVATAATFHDPTCRVVDGRTDLTPMAPASAIAHGLTACRVCEPRTSVA